jgi:hypothetical protein
MNLQSLNLVELNAQEIHSVEGGIGWEWLAEQVIANWDDIKHGFVAGWNSVP